MHVQKQIWALQKQLELRDDASTHAEALAASQAKEVEAKLAGLAAQLARLHPGCTVGRGATSPCLQASHRSDANQPGSRIKIITSL